jgi:CubicO group peptidase (beta-lactamase class C family)
MVIRVKKLLWLRSSLLVLAIPFLAGSTPGPDPIDEYVQSVMEKHGIPGIALAIVKDGELVRTGTYGLANVELGVSVKPESVFEISSVTKPFTATAIMMLVEEGKIQLDDPIGAYLDGTPEDWNGITVRHLLSHTVSLSPRRPERNDGRDYTTKEMFDGIKEWGLDFTPGERWQYFDLGYFLLGMILEKQSGKRYREYLSERIFQPTGMARSTVIDQWDLVPDRVAGYTFRGGKLAHIRRHTQIELPSFFGILSTVMDLAKWDVALRSGEYIAEATLEEMWTPVRLNDGSTFPFGLGWLLMDHRGQKRALHSGGTGSNITHFPDHDLTVIVLTNLGHVADFAWHVALGVAGHYVPELLPPDMISVQRDPSPERTEELKRFLIQLSSSAQPEGMTSQLRAILPHTSRFRVASYRTLESLKYVACDVVPVGGLERMGAEVNGICHYRATIGRGVFFVTFWLTADGTVVDFMPFRDFAGDGFRW